MNELLVEQLNFFINEIGRALDMSPNAIVKDVTVYSISEDIAECFAAAIDNREPELNNPLFSRAIYLEMSNDVRKRNG